MQTEIDQTLIDQKLHAIIAQEEGYGPVDPTPEEQEKYLKKYSISALVFSVVYFWQMKDKTFFWFSALSSLIFFPLVFILPFFSRRRAFQKRKWHSFNHFAFVQKKWDDYAIVGLIVSVVAFFLISWWEVNLLNNYLHSSGLNNMNDIQQLQDQLQETLGN
jgi:hypothetical protein